MREGGGGSDDGGGGESNDDSNGTAGGMGEQTGECVVCMDGENTHTHSSLAATSACARGVRWRSCRLHLRVRRAVARRARPFTSTRDSNDGGGVTG